MADNLKEVEFSFNGNSVWCTLVEIGERQWNSFNTQAFYQTGTWDASWADDVHRYDELGISIDDATSMRTIITTNVDSVNLRCDPTKPRGIRLSERVTGIGFTKFDFMMFDGMFVDATAVCNNNSDGYYSECYLAHATVDDDEYIGFLGWNTNPNSYYYHKPMFIVNWAYSDWLIEHLHIPGKAGYRPTGTKYRPGSGIGGQGHNATEHGKNPAYTTDVLENPDAPDESSASAISSGMVKAYDITPENLSGVASCLWGSNLQTLITGMLMNPLDYIVSLNIFPTQPVFGSSRTIKLGRWECSPGNIEDGHLGATATGLPLTKQFKTISFGTINVYENWGSFLDYSHSQIELYLPFIGCVDIDTAEVMNGTITVDYTIDFFTGMCVANVNCNKTVETPDGRTYSQYSQHSYQGNCAINIPLSQVQYGNMIGSLINAGTAGLKSGIAGVGISLASDVASGGFKPSVTTKGTISANAGYCSILQPYIRITRPISAEPDSYQEVVGYTSYIDTKLGECTDLCVCESIDLSSVTGATENELNRIRQMCLEGVHV